MLKRIAYLFPLLFLLVACQSSTPVPTQVTKETIPTPEAGTGTLYGKLMNTDTGKPYEATLFLSENITDDEPGFPPVVAFSYQTDPRARQKEDGSFIFSNVKPGKYVITLFQGNTQDYYIKKNDKGEKELIMFEVKADQAIDLGTLTYP